MTKKKTGKSSKTTTSPKQMKMLKQGKPVKVANDVKEDKSKKSSAMKKKRRTFHVSSIVALANIFELVAIVIALLMAFSFQFLLKELPCPLCLLQRLGFLMIAFGFLMNLRFGFKPSHYAIVILSALFTAFISLRQITLHVIPGTGSFGSTFMGYHLYTWSFIAAVTVLVVTSILLGVEHQYKATTNVWWRHASHGLFALVAILLVANVASVLMECGLSVCPANPTHYMFSFFR